MAGTCAVADRLGLRGAFATAAVRVSEGDGDIDSPTEIAVAAGGTDIFFSILPVDSWSNITPEGMGSWHGISFLVPT